MSTLGKAVLQAVALWFHLGVEPLFGGGPMQSLHKTQSRRARSVLPSDGKTLTPSPQNNRARRARQRSHPPHSNPDPLSRSAVAKRADAACGA
jgi:hypothetical protein